MGKPVRAPTHSPTPKKTAESEPATSSYSGLVLLEGIQSQNRSMASTRKPVRDDIFPSDMMHIVIRNLLASVDHDEVSRIPARECEQSVDDNVFPISREQYRDMDSLVRRQIAEHQQRDEYYPRDTENQNQTFSR